MCIECGFIGFSISRLIIVLCEVEMLKCCWWVSMLLFSLMYRFSVLLGVLGLVRVVMMLVMLSVCFCICLMVRKCYLKK